MGLIVTNNPFVCENAVLSKADSLVFVRGKYLAVLNKARDFVHKGHRLLSHPLSGSVKPGETPYKTLVLGEAGGGLCYDSLRIIEESVLMARKLGIRERQYNEQVLKDLQLIDYTLIFGKGGTTCTM